MVFKVKPQAKKAKRDLLNSEETLSAVETCGGDKVETPNDDKEESHFASNSSLVSYSESEED